MASDRQRFNRASSRWETLLKSGSVSVPYQEGITAIVCPYVRYIDGNRDKKNQKEYYPDTSDSQISQFVREAKALADRLKKNGSEVDLILDARTSDMDTVLTDPKIQGIVTIGLGTISMLSMFNGKDLDRYDWERVSQQADHLKTGYIIQRVCGIYALNLNVPFGTFASVNPMNVYAAAGSSFEPTSLDDDTNNLLQPVSSTGRLTYEDVRNRFRKPGVQLPTLPSYTPVSS